MNPLTLQGAQLIALLLNSLHGILQNYEAHIKGQDIVARLGLGLIKGQITNILHLPNSTITPSLHAELTHLITESDRLYSLGPPTVTNDREDDIFNKLVDEPWSFNESSIFRLTDPSMVWGRDDRGERKLRLEKIRRFDNGSWEGNERQSDRCIAEILSHEPGTPCDLSQYCLANTLLQTHTDEYILTHQLLFPMVATMQSCHTPITDFLHQNTEMSLDDWYISRCTNVIHEMKQINFTQKSTDIVRDLMMEQLWICGQLGFVEIHRIEWLLASLRWQDRYGCFDKTGAQFNSKSRQNQASFRCTRHTLAQAIGTILSFMTTIFVGTPPEWSHLRLDRQPFDLDKAGIAYAGAFKSFDISSWHTANSEHDDVDYEWVTMQQSGHFYWRNSFMIFVFIGLILLYCWLPLLFKKQQKLLYHYAYKKL